MNQYCHSDDQIKKPSLQTYPWIYRDLKETLAVLNSQLVKYFHSPYSIRPAMRLYEHRRAEHAGGSHSQL